jgi:hypothetical protein
VISCKYFWGCMVSGLIGLFWSNSVSIGSAGEVRMHLCIAGLDSRTKVQMFG